jgi:hypothetical protein
VGGLFLRESREDAACMRRGQGPWPGRGGAAARWSHDASGRVATDSGTRDRQCSGDERWAPRVAS